MTRKFAAAALFATALVSASPAFAASMSVQTFLAKADKLKKRGPFALLSGDLKLLMRQVNGDFAALRAERTAALEAGKTPSYCPPGKVAMGEKEVMGAMQAVPAGQRASTSTRMALRAYLIRRFPCRG